MFQCDILVNSVTYHAIILYKASDDMKECQSGRRDGRADAFGVSLGDRFQSRVFLGNNVCKGEYCSECDGETGLVDSDQSELYAVVWNLEFISRRR